MEDKAKMANNPTGKPTPNNEVENGTKAYTTNTGNKKIAGAKVNKNLSFIGSYYNITLNNDVTEVSLTAHGLIQSHIGVLETNWKINKKHSLRTELQALFTEKDKGNWATIVAEYSISPGWFFSVMDQYNYGNKDVDLRIHYIIGSLGYTHDATRIMASYGRQRAGLFCVGGVCRFVPASNGLTLTVSHSF